MKIILGSSSPRRKALLEGEGFSFRILTGETQEVIFPGKGEETALHNAKEKALAAGRLFREELSFPLAEETLIIGADTLIEAEGKILGKPSSKEEAFSYLSLLSGKTHKVITGVGLLLLPAGFRKDSPFPEVKLFPEITLVTFRELTEEMIRKYMAHVPVMDKAGAYAIQEYGEWILEKMEGNLDNVIGLPVKTLKKILAAKVQGIKEVLVPWQNEKNIKELETEITDGVTVTFVSHMDEVIKKAFVASEK